MLSLCHGFLDKDVWWALGNLPYQQISNSLRQVKLEYQSHTNSIVSFTLCQDYASADMPARLSGAKMSCHLHCSCLSLWKPASFNMFGLSVQNNTNGLSESWRNFEGGVSVTPISSTAQSRPSEASHFTLFWCCINHGGWLWQGPLGDLMEVKRVTHWLLKAGLCKMLY